MAATKALAKLASQHAKPPRACGGVWAAVTPAEVREVLRAAPARGAPGLSEAQREALVEAIRAGGSHGAEAATEVGMEADAEAADAEVAGAEAGAAGAASPSLLDLQQLQPLLEGERLARLLGGGATSEPPATVRRKAAALWHFCRGQVAGAEQIRERPPPRQLSCACSFTVRVRPSPLPDGGELQPMGHQDARLRWGRAALTLTHNPKPSPNPSPNPNAVQGPSWRACASSCCSTPPSSPPPRASRRASSSCRRG